MHLLPVPVSSANAIATASPTPLSPPVITATLPERGALDEAVAATHTVQTVALVV